MGNIFLHEGSSGFGDSGKAYVFRQPEKGEKVEPEPIAPPPKLMTHGQAAYETYCEERNWKAYNNEPLKDWTELDSEIKCAWQLAAGAGIMNYLKNPGNKE